MPSALAEDFEIPPPANGMYELAAQFLAEMHNDHGGRGDIWQAQMRARIEAMREAADHDVIPWADPDEEPEEYEQQVDAFHDYHRYAAAYDFVVTVVTRTQHECPADASLAAYKEVLDQVWQEEWDLVFRNWVRRPPETHFHKRFEVDPDKGDSVYAIFAGAYLAGAPDVARAMEQLDRIRITPIGREGEAGMEMDVPGDIIDTVAIVAGMHRAPRRETGSL